ncbi:oxidoreductase [Sphingomonas morindae]|uniref:SDR family NAD(P)-dependent oxidoreductase n=1 Tax=Sphingomonas morindae TaxID=1541170 RepID=A0ABY4XCT5_9SPHN|nr:oxidoreductase [Sphingomonas morindae]USI74723.1 SDR family NAD(P)-dependent oxidoreductase [Sphingomonas morindae]
MALPADPVWFITGCSTGFGRELARLVLDRGWRVVVTARAADRVADLAALAEDRALALALDVTDAAQIDAAVAAATARFGRIDVLVNNAGYGYQTSIEEGEEAEIRAQFDANVFGLFALTRAVLPHMRAQGGGAILNITSVGGITGFAASGYYSATKHAVEGWSASLAAEVEPLGISVTCVEPGPFRTDWAGRSLRQTPSRISAYAETAAARMATTSGYSGRQPGDPVRAGAAMIEAVTRPVPPRHLVLGAFAYETARDVFRTRLEALEADRDLALGADYPEGEG